jgi:hypothetical protein
LRAATSAPAVAATAVIPSRRPMGESIKDKSQRSSAADPPANVSSIDLSRHRSSVASGFHGSTAIALGAARWPWPPRQGRSGSMAPSLGNLEIRAMCVDRQEPPIADPSTGSTADRPKHRRQHRRRSHFVRTATRPNHETTEPQNDPAAARPNRSTTEPQTPDAIRPSRSTSEPPLDRTTAPPTAGPVGLSAAELAGRGWRHRRPPVRRTVDH